MWSDNPSKGQYVVAICYNMGYDFANADHSEITSVQLKSGSLHTEFVTHPRRLLTAETRPGQLLTGNSYDCMYMQKGNTFFPRGDGGFINYSYNSDGSCTHTDGMLLLLPVQACLYDLVAHSAYPWHNP